MRRVRRTLYTSMTDEISTSDVIDPLLAPFTDLNARKIPIQDDKYRGWLLAIYCSFLLIGLPIWWYCTNVPSVTIPSRFHNEIKTHLQHDQEFTVNLLGEDITMPPMIMNGYSFKFISTSKIENDTPFTINLVISKDLENSKRTIVIKDSKEIERVLTELTKIKFQVPKFKKSKIKLKFHYLTDTNENFSWNFMENFDNFLSHLRPVVSFDTSYYTKYYDSTNEVSAEMFFGANSIVNFDSRADRGRGDIFKFVLIKGKAEKVHYIDNWGIILQFTPETKIDSVLLEGLKRLLGFPDIESCSRKMSELVEIDFWISNVKKFYLSETEKMVGLLINEPSSVVIRPEIYKTKLHVAWNNLRDPKMTFDLVESAYHDPKMIAAAYFPDEHKFAVYLPVFLPLILPIIVALMAFIKEKRKKNSDKLKTQ